MKNVLIHTAIYFFFPINAKPRLLWAATQVGCADKAAFSLTSAASRSLCWSIIAASANAAGCCVGCWARAAPRSWKARRGSPVRNRRAPAAAKVSAPHAWLLKENYQSVKSALTKYFYKLLSQQISLHYTYRSLLYASYFTIIRPITKIIKPRYNIIAKIYFYL